MDEEAASSADRTLLRHQQHTLRERIHLVERRIHELEMAQYHGAIRVDAHADAITEIKTTLEKILAEFAQMETP